MEPKRVIFSFFWNFFTLSQKFYTHGAHDKYQVGERTYWVSALILQKPHICRSLDRALFNNKDSQKDFAAGCVPSQFHSVPFHGRTEIKSVSVWVWGVGGSRFVGVLLPKCQPKTISPTELLLSSHLLLTNTFRGRIHVGEKYCQIKSEAE